jgi:hypothetical protein
MRFATYPPVIFAFSVKRAAGERRVIIFALEFTRHMPIDLWFSASVNA